jgi:poly(3-hydroxybutyrate) depolymerase
MFAALAVQAGLRYAAGVPEIARPLQMMALVGTFTFEFEVSLPLVNAPITNSAVSGMPREQGGVAAGIASASRQGGQVLGVAVMGSVLTASLHGSLQSGFAAATRPGWWIIAA